MHKLFQPLLFIILIVIFGLWSIHVGQDVNWDLRNYHFYNPYAFLHNRMQWDIAPAMLQTYINPFLDIINYALIVSLKPSHTGFILGAISGISAFVVYLTAELLFTDRFYALLATLIGATGCATISQLGTTTNENKIALLIILAFYFVLKAISSNTLLKKYFVAAGFCIGLAIGFKLTAATYGLGIFAGLLCCQKLSRTQLYCLGWFALSATAAFFIADGYWLWKMYSLFKNPLFPYYNNIFHSPYGEFISFSGSAFTPQDWLHYLFLPFFLIKSNHLTIETTMRDPRLAFAYFLAIMWAGKYFVTRHAYQASSTAKFFFVAFLTSYLAWLIQFSIYRYAIPLEYCAGITIIYLLAVLIKSRLPQVIAMSFVTTLILLTTSYPAWATRTSFGGNYFTTTAHILPPHSLVLLVYEPCAYMAPLLSSTTPIRFIGIDNNLTFPTKTNDLQKMIRHVIQHHAGPIFTLTYPQDNDRAKNDIHYYNLTQRSSQCQMISTNAQDHFILCPTK